MSKLTLSFRTKLLMFWLGSIMVVLLLVGAVYFYLHTARLTTASLVNIENTFAALEAKIVARKDVLLNNAEIIARQRETVSILSMIDTYQNIDDYQPLIFDPEKRILTDELVQYAQSIDLDLLMAHDSKSMLASFYVNDRETGPKGGYQSFRDGKSVLFVSGKANTKFQEKTRVPVILNHAVIPNLQTTSKVRFRGVPLGIFLEAFVPVVTASSANAQKTIGTIHAAYLLDNPFFKEISARQRFEYAFVLPNGAHFGSLDVSSFENDLFTAPILTGGNEDGAKFQQFPSKTYMIGAVRLPLADGQNAYFVLGEEKAALTSRDASLEQALLTVLLLAGLILIPSATYYMNRTFTKPFENLLVGVEGLRNGVYEQVTNFSSIGELSALSQSFNLMMQAIKDREKDLHESEERFRALSNYSPNKLHLKNLEGRYTLINPKSEALFNLTNAQAIGKTASDIFPDDMSRAFDLHDKTVIETGKPVEVEEVFHLDDGPHTYLTVKFPILGAHGEIVAIGSSGFEITERKRAEAQLFEAKREAEQSSKAKSEFLASMSHELRTPLNAILGFTQMLQIDPTDTLSDTQRDYIETILNGGNHLLDLVNELLDLAKIEANQLSLTLEDVNANDSVADCVNQISALGEPRGIQLVNKFNNNPNVFLRTDPLRFKQIVLNLLSNAVKYNRDGGTVTVEGWETDNNFLHLSITDSGIGIAEKDHAKVFQIFNRLEADPMVAREGTGIGLTVTKILVEQMAGRVGFKSEVDIGSQFWIELPLVSNDEVLIWTDALRVGVDTIDKEHQLIISLLNRVTCQSIGDVDLDDDIQELVGYTQQYFQRKETIMQICGCEDLDQHRRTHQDLIAQMDGFGDQWHKNNNPETLHEFRKFLRNLLYTDILDANACITPFAKGKDQDIRQALNGLDQTVNHFPPTS